jgi:hypothetical protein
MAVFALMGLLAVAACDDAEEQTTTETTTEPTTESATT